MLQRFRDSFDRASTATTCIFVELARFGQDRQHASTNGRRDCCTPSSALPTRALSAPRSKRRRRCHPGDLALSDRKTAPSKADPRSAPGSSPFFGSKCSTRYEAEGGPLSPSTQRRSPKNSSKPTHPRFLTNRAAGQIRKTVGLGRVEQLEFFRRLEACMTQLPATMSRVFLMREWLEIPPDEICQTLSLSPGNLRVVLYRARVQLRHCLEKRSPQ